MKRIHRAGLAATAIAGLAVVTITVNVQAAQPGGSAVSPVAAARSNAVQLGIGDGGDLVVRDVVVDGDGSSHVRFDRTYQGLPVVGGDVVVHQDKAGKARSATGGVGKLALSVKPAVSAASATAATKQKAGKQQLVVFVTNAGHSKLAYKVVSEGRKANGEPTGTETYVDAQNGKVLDSWTTVNDDLGSGTGLYVGTVGLDTTKSGTSWTMVDPVRGGNATYNAGTLFSDADNVWGTGSNSNAQTAGVDAHYGIAKTWDYYKSVHGRNGIANDGKGAKSYVHDGAYVNASWSDSCFCMRYGDGDASQGIGPLVELDIAGHEMSHGVTSRSAGLRYSGESGGLNESTSDIFGTAVEWYAANSQDTPDYVLGEEIFTDYNPATNYIRRLDKPSMDGASADAWSKGVGRLNVHYSSGVGNHFFYLLSEGSGAKTINGVAYNSPTANGVTVTGIGITKAEKIWYRALTTYMTSRTDYHGARTATLNAATDLYGASSAERAAVDKAWAGVNVLP
ncbi:Zn-dependent metalloprotease [Kribbella sp. VKM Ac-2569]|uniref:M4 family metallopeptidase n=1 Tax=Kribbella sp. VKM Ac-2569 TaxID=2512220 RepID=UPI00102AE45A|nr:M4 family metallopeptidase [Kribbella sp. VKM Ac-2569]RZT16993.1 Zn-dependent metalloprotease [Kribbella sp. VKM Ac-2569]